MEEDYELDFDLLIRAAIEMGNRLDGQKNPYERETLIFAEGLGQKIIHHTLSVRRLIEGYQLANMTNRFLAEFSNIPDSASLVQDVVRSWFEQSLVETIIGVQSPINRKDWTPVDIDNALSEEALTAAVMQRYHIHTAVRRELSLKMGARK